MNEPVTSTDNWSKHWRDKIAVRITSIVLWSLSFFCMLFASLLISQVREQTESEQNMLLDQLSQRIIEQAYNKNGNFKSATDDILKNRNFNHINIQHQNKQYNYGVNEDNSTIMTRKFSPPIDIEINASVTPIEKSVRHRQIEIFMIFSISLVSLGAFLGLIIDKYVHKPFQALESTIQQFTAGNKNIRVNVDTKDEFGALACFTNEMLDSIDEKTQKLTTEARERRIAAQKVEEQRDALQSLTEELTSARDQAYAASNAKSSFLANMSHELRTPLNAIIGYSELLMEEANDVGNTTQSEDLEKIRIAGKHLLTLINDILDLSKIEAGRMDFHLETFGMKQLIEETINMVTPIISANNNTFNYQLPTQDITMHSDITRVKQILFNLLSNASKFTKDGDIRMNIRMIDSDNINFEIIDTGIGIEPHKIESLFREFSQADNSTTREYGGTGLGLSICRRLCRLMGGDIVASSELGTGSSFTAILPLYTQQITVSSI